MLSGRQTLASIDQALRQIRNQNQEVDEQVQATSNALMELQQQQAERYKKLAEIRLDHMISGGVAEEFDAANRRVSEVLETRARALEELDSQTQDARAKEVELESKHGEVMAGVARAAEAVDKAEAVVQHRLEQDPTYAAQLENARRAELVAGRAEAKTKQAQQNRGEKGKPYEDDPLFFYLWTRGFGTSRYAANSLVRFLDKWVAQLCNYHDARPNYSLLLEIPERLDDHAQNVRAAANREFEALKALEEKQAEADGLPALRQVLDHAEQQLDQVDDEIHQAEENERVLLRKRTSFAAGEDDYSRQAVKILSEVFERENLTALFRYVEETPTAEDDILVQETAAAHRRSDQLKQTLAEQKRAYERYLTRLQELEEIYQRFKRERYNSNYSSFPNAAVVSLILRQFLQGMATGDDLWGTIQREQRHRRIESDPSFGSGGFPHTGGTWRTPFPGGLGGSWGGGRRGRWDGGGSGGLGGGTGGGFKTGGGF